MSWQSLELGCFPLLPSVKGFGSWIFSFGLVSEYPRSDVEA